MKIHSAARKTLAAALALIFIFAGDEEFTHC